MAFLLLAFGWKLEDRKIVCNLWWLFKNCIAVQNMSTEGCEAEH